MLENWRRVWRDALGPMLSIDALTALRQGLATDDKRMIQGSTTQPPPIQAIGSWACEGACLIGYAGWRGHELDTIREVSEFFARTCAELETRMGEPAVVRHLTAFWDETPRPDAIALLLPEVDRSIALLMEGVANVA